jgi:hypothetical protein
MAKERNEGRKERKKSYQEHTSALFFTHSILLEKL